MKQEWVELVNGERKFEIRGDKFLNLLNFLIEIEDRIEYQFSDIRVNKALKQLSLNVQSNNTQLQQFYGLMLVASLAKGP